MTTHWVTIDTWGPGAKLLPEEWLEDLFRALEARGARGTIPSAGGASAGIGASFAMIAKGWGDATRRGVAMFESACRAARIAHGGIARVEVATPGFVEADATKEPDAYLGLAEVAGLLGVSRQRVSELRLKPNFPSPVARLAAGPVWSRRSLELFLRDWERKPGRPKRAAV